MKGGSWESGKRQWIVNPVELVEISPALRAGSTRWHRKAMTAMRGDLLAQPASYFPFVCTLHPWQQAPSHTSHAT